MVRSILSPTVQKKVLALLQGNWTSVTLYAVGSPIQLRHWTGPLPEENLEQYLDSIETIYQELPDIETKHKYSSMSFGCWFNLFFLALFIPVLLIFFNGLGSFLILDSTFKNDALVLMASLMVFSSIFLFVIHRGNSSSLFNFICSLGLAALYIAMGTVQGLKIINAHFDESEPQTVEVSITKKYRGSSDSGYYYKVVFF